MTKIESTFIYVLGMDLIGGPRIRYMSKCFQIFGGQVEAYTGLYFAFNLYTFDK